MAEVHIKEALKENIGWVLLGGAFVLGIVAFALMSAGFVG
jgi:hypothetical protein